MSARHYSLVCPVCDRVTADDGLRLNCAGDHPPALLRTEYRDSQLRIDRDAPGLFRYRNWLPVVRTVAGAGRTVVYRSVGLGRTLGLSELWIAFNGYWPERGAELRTGTFKELEAYTVVGRLPERPPVLVVPSVGNTAAAFAAVLAGTGMSCVLVVPGRGLHRLSGVNTEADGVTLVSVDDGDYADAMTFADQLSALPGFQAVGGVWNVARRDGLATVLLSAVEAMGRPPEHYFQAVGSAVGAIAVHEAANRLVASGEYAAVPRLMMCQNQSFAPIHRLWSAAGGPEPARRQTYADELVNARPPYFVPGGIEDALRASKGEVLLSTARAAADAGELFLATEHIDIEPAAAVAVSCLRAAIAEGRIRADAQVLLNITGGGRALLPGAGQVRPALRLDRAELSDPGCVSRVAELCVDNLSAI